MTDYAFPWTPSTLRQTGADHTTARQFLDDLDQYAHAMDTAAAHTTQHRNHTGLRRGQVVQLEHKGGPPHD
jgi:hypothetical protein